MTILPYTTNNAVIIQEFLNETKKRISDGVEIVFTKKANIELEDLVIEYDISGDDIEYAILNLTVENYYKGIDPSTKSDFEVCAFRAFVGKDKVEIYLKYGIKVEGLEILIFSNHIPNTPMTQPFKN